MLLKSDPMVKDQLQKGLKFKSVLTLSQPRMTQESLPTAHMIPYPNHPEQLQHCFPLKVLASFLKL